MHSTVKKHLGTIRHLALDMDGTIYRGRTLFNSTLPFLTLCREMGISYSFLTNNPSKSTGDYLAHLKKMGITASADELYTSTQATIQDLIQEWPQGKRF